MLNLAVSAFTHAAFHVPLKGYQYLPTGYVFCQEFLNHELIHDRRTDHYGKGSFRLQVDTRYKRCDESYVSLPFRNRTIYSTFVINVHALFPLLNLVNEKYIPGAPATQQYVNFPEISPVVKYIFNQGSQRCNAQ